MTRPLFDWRRDIVPSRSVIRFVQTVEEGRISRSGFETSAAVPGGRAQLTMEFDLHFQPMDIVSLSWTASRLKGNLFRVPIPQTAQIARDSDLGLPDDAYGKGIPFDGGAYFASGVGFAFDPTVDTAGTALEGETEIPIDETRWPGAVRPGKWIGIGFGCYHVDDTLHGSGNTVAVTLSPPLRRDVSAGEFVSLRPSLICQARDASSFTSMFDAGEIVQPGSVTMMEARDERFR